MTKILQIFRDGISRGQHTPTTSFPHASIDFTSPDGPKLSFRSSKCRGFQIRRRMYQVSSVKSKLATAKKISAVSAKVNYSYDYAVFLGKLMRKDYDVIFYAGGHGPVIDHSMRPTSNSRRRRESIGLSVSAPARSSLQADLAMGRRYQFTIRYSNFSHQKLFICTSQSPYYCSCLPRRSS